MAHWEMFSDMKYKENMRNNCGQTSIRNQAGLTPANVFNDEEAHTDHSIVNNSAKPPSRTDELLREGVDFSEGGWATDTAASIVGFLFLVTAFQFYGINEVDGNSGRDFKHFVFLYGGTWIAHLFGGLAHRFFPNRAADGIGQVGFYLAMMVGYSGNCLRYGFGWGLFEGDIIQEFPWRGYTSIFPWFALGNIVFFVVAGLFVIVKMKRTNQVVDEAEGLSFKPDILFGLGETFTAIMENVAPIIYLVLNRDNSRESLFAISAVVINTVGWAAVYFSGFLYITFDIEYNPNLMQRVFHYCMIAMLWAVDSFVRRETEM